MFSETLAKAHPLPAIVAISHEGGVGSPRCHRRLKRGHGWYAVGLHFSRNGRTTLADFFIILLIGHDDHYGMDRLIILST